MGYQNQHVNLFGCASTLLFVVSSGITAMNAEEHRLRSRRAAVREIRQGPLVDLDETLADSDRE